MRGTIRLIGGLVAFALLVGVGVSAVGAQGPPDFTKFGYPTVAKSMDLTPDQAATITAGDQSVSIKAGTFDVPVTFDLLTSEPSAWKDLVKDRTVRAAFAFRVTDKASKAIIATFKQPVAYSYSGKDAQGTDVILNTTAASPPVISVNAAPITFDGKVNHPFGGAGVGWLVASATTGAAGTPAAAAASPAVSATTASTPAAVAQASPAASASAAASTVAPTAASTVAPTATRPAATTAPVATGTGGGTVATAAPTTLPKTGEARATRVNPLQTVIFGSGIALLIAGIALIMRRRAAIIRD